MIANSSPAKAADYYKVSVTRIEQNFYREEISRLLIRTRYCYEYTYSEDAVFVWDGRGSWDDKLIFNSGNSCEVEGVYRS